MKKYLLLLLLLVNIPTIAYSQWDIPSTATVNVVQATVNVVQDTVRATYEEAYNLNKHFHNYHRIISKNTVQTSTVKADTTAGKFYPYVLTAAADSTFGAAVQVLGTDDTPVQTGMKWFDLHDGFVIAANSNSPYVLRILAGSSAAVALAAGDYSDTWIFGDDSNPNKASPVEFSLGMKRFAVGSLVWAQISNAAGAQTLSVVFSLHEYVR